MERGKGMRRTLVIGLMVAAVGLAACSNGVSQEDYAALQTERDQLAALGQTLQSDKDTLTGELTTEQERASGLEAQLVEAQETLASETARAGAAEGQVTELEGQLSTAQGELTDAESALTDALAEAEALTIAYDPQIQAARAEAGPVAMTLACAMGRADARQSLRHDADAVFTELAGDYPGVDLAAVLDDDAINTEMGRCREEETALIAEEAEQERLTAPRGDGFYTVGDEIAAGKWRSTGTGDDCYWERLDANQEILDNHFGSAGGTVTIRPSDYEVRFEDCGQWEYLGP